MMLGLTLMTGRPLYPWWPADCAFAADFVNDRYMRDDAVVDRATALAFARSTPKLAEDTQGIWHNFGINRPAITDQGLLLEPAATNQVSNAAMIGATIGVIDAGGALPAGWTIADFDSGEITAIGNEDGLPFIELRLRHENTSGASQFPRLNCAGSISANIGEQWTASCFYKKVAGTWPANTGAFLNVQEVGTTTAYATADRPPLEVRTRVATTWWTSSAGTIALEMRALMFNLSPAEVLDVTVRLYAPQLAKEAVASSPILTSGTAATRSADVAALSLPTGSHSLAKTFDDGSTQNVAGQSGDYSLSSSGVATLRGLTAT